MPVSWGHSSKSNRLNAGGFRPNETGQKASPPTKGRLGVNFEKVHTGQLSQARRGKGLLRTTAVVSLVLSPAGLQVILLLLLKVHQDGNHTESSALPGSKAWQLLPPWFFMLF